MALDVDKRDAISVSRHWHLVWKEPHVREFAIGDRRPFTHEQIMTQESHDVNDSGW